MARIFAGVTINEIGSPLVPGAPGNLRLSGTLVPNPQSDNLRLSYDAPVIPAGGTPATEYRIYQDGVHVKTGTTMRPNVLSLTPGTTYKFRVSAVNTFGEGAKSNELTVTTLGGGAPPGAPSNLRGVGTPGLDRATLAWDVETPSPTEPTTGYNVYESTGTTPVASTAAGVLTVEVLDLASSTTYSYTVKAVNAIGESAASAPVEITTGSAPVNHRRADDLRSDYSAINTKTSYGPGTTYGYNANTTDWSSTDAVGDHLIALGYGIYREKVAISGPAAAKQSRILARLAAAGMRWHVTIGSTRNDPQTPNLTTMSEAEVRVEAKNQVSEALAKLVGYIPLAPGGDITKLLHSLAGPNEVDNVGDCGTNWARNQAIFQNELWQQARNGRDVPSYVATFQDIPIAAPSTRTDLIDNLPKADEAGRGGVLNTPGYIIDRCELGNPHLYQHGVSPHKDLQSMLNAITPISNGYPAVFSETGYNHSGWDSNGNYLGPITVGGGLAVPDWVAATYQVRAVPVFALKKAVYILFELLDDIDNPATLGVRQAHFGQLRMPTNALATSTPPTWVLTPQYYATRRFHNLLKDRPGGDAVRPTFELNALSRTVTPPTGVNVNFRQMLLEKSNGHWLLLIWRDVDVWNASPNAEGTPITVPEVNVSIQFPVARTITVYQPNTATATNKTGTTAVNAPAVSGFNAVALGANTPLQIPLGANLRVVDIS